MKNRMALCNWSPIRTAPRRGQEIWLGAGDEMALGFWGKVQKRGIRGGKPKHVKCWVGKSPLGQLPFEPTHWQRIPNPPRA